MRRVICCALLVASFVSCRGGDGVDGDADVDEDADESPAAVCEAGRAHICECADGDDCSTWAAEDCADLLSGAQQIGPACEAATVGYYSCALRATCAELAAGEDCPAERSAVGDDC